MPINHAAVFVCAALNLLIGGIWYSPFLFANAWMKESGTDPEKIKTANRGKIFGLTFLFAVIMSYNLAFFFNDPKIGPMQGLLFGFATGFGFCALMFGVISLFELRSVKYMLINGGFMTVYFTVSGFILASWR